MESLLHSAFHPEDFRKQGHALVDLLADYLTLAQRDGLDTVLPHREPAEQLAYWQADFQKPLNADPLPLLQEILQQSIHLHHPRYMGHQVAPPLPLAALTGLLTGLLNNGMALYEMGEVSGTLEKIVTEWLAGQLGLPAEATGILTSGGTLATLTALLAARANAAPEDVWEEGTQTRLAVMVSEEAHYCVDRAVRIMGLGSAGIIKIPVNDRYQMRTDLLETYYQQATAKGTTVFAVIGSACTTSTGSYDDLPAIADFCGRHGCWFHVDGAHGGGAALSETYRQLVQGIDRANSVVVDFHKMLLTPALITAVLFRRSEDSYRTFQQKAQYLWANQESPDWFNLGKRTFECTKWMMSIKVYTILRTYGPELLRANIETLYNLGRRLAILISERPDFELATTPEANIVCFRYVGNRSQPEQFNEVNSRIRKQIVQDGRFYIVQTTLREQVYLRVSLMNPLTTETHLTEMLDWVRKIAGDGKAKY